MGRVQRFFWCLTFCLVGFEGCQDTSDIAIPNNSLSPSSITPAQSGYLDPPYTLAVLPFENLSQHARLNWLRRGLQEMLVSDLAKWPHLEVVSRDALGPVLREQWLQQRGFSSDANPVLLGQLKGVRYLIQGNMYVQGPVLTVDLQVVDVRTGVVVGSIKAQGLESEIPRLEQDLVAQAMLLFDPSQNLNARLTSGEITEEVQKLPNKPVRLEEEGENTLPSGKFDSHSVHQIDAFLSLEKLTYQRREAYRLAANIWNEGWVSEIGQPMYHVLELPNRSIRSVPIMAIPISLFFSSHRLADILKKTWNSTAGPGVRFDSEGYLVTTDEGTGANQLFVGHFQDPRRVYVRALNEQNDVLAIFSDWAWRTESKIHMVNPQKISVPMWPKPFITGMAQFPVNWIEREGLHVTFDAVVVPVPDEQAIVTLELLESEEDKYVVGQDINEANLLQTLEQSIRSHWSPAITEGLPLLGYLPGNKRTAVGIVQIQDGKIVQVQFHHSPDEPFFLRSLRDLQSNILGSCVACQDSGRIVLSPVSKNIRFQLTLVKDIHALQLGSHSP